MLSLFCLSCGTNYEKELTRQTTSWYNRDGVPTVLLFSPYSGPNSQPQLSIQKIYHGLGIEENKYSYSIEGNKIVIKNNDGASDVWVIENINNNELTINGVTYYKVKNAREMDEIYKMAN